jgi:protein-disulfide isomerase
MLCYYFNNFITSEPYFNEMKSKLILPIAVMVAGLVVAISLFGANFGKKSYKPINDNERLKDIILLNTEDYYFGNPAAPIVLIEYSDYDCTFCSGYFQNMKRIIEDFGKTGKIVWVHRHMPLFQIHPYAFEKAEFAECVGAIGGQDAFWKASETLYMASLNYEEVDFDDITLDLSIPSNEINECLDTGRFKDKVQSQYDEAFKAGSRGTPFTVIIKGEERYAIPESLPYFELREIISSLLQDL